MRGKGEKKNFVATLPNDKNVKEGGGHIFVTLPQGEKKKIFVKFPTCVESEKIEILKKIFKIPNF